MPTLKETIGKTGNKKTQRNNVIRYFSMLFIKSEKNPYFMIINKTDWYYLKSLPGITDYININYIKETFKKGLLGSLWKTFILLANNSKEIKIYHKNNIDNMKKDFPDNKDMLNWIPQKDL